MSDQDRIKELEKKVAWLTNEATLRMATDGRVAQLMNEIANLKDRMAELKDEHTSLERQIDWIENLNPADYLDPNDMKEAIVRRLNGQ